MRTGSIVIRIVGFLLLLALLAGGAYAVYNLGYGRGLAESPAMLEAMQEEGGMPMPYYGYRAPAFYPWFGFGFFPFGGICGGLFFLLLFFGLMRMVFFPRRWGWHGRHGHWRHGPPPWGKGPESPEQQAPPAGAAPSGQ